MITRDMILDDAARMNVEPAMCMAFAEVESNGIGFLSDGRPTILFEAQIFHQQTGGIYDASHPGISSLTWNQSLYRGGAGEYDRLAEASALNVEAAYRSISMGAYQIMGFNYRVCGYASAVAMFGATKISLKVQVDEFVSFCMADPTLMHAMRTFDFDTCARIYNGPGAVASYSGKLRLAYNVHAKEDAKFAAGIPAPPVAPPDPVFDALVPPPAPVPAIAPTPIAMTPAQAAEGPPLPVADAITPPPAGFTQQPSGNLVIDDIGKSTIIKGAKVGQVLTGVGTAAVTAATGAQAVKSVFAGFTPSDVGIIVMGVVAVAAMISVLIYLGFIRKERTNMNKQGIA